MIHSDPGTRYQHLAFGRATEARGKPREGRRGYRLFPLWLMQFRMVAFALLGCLGAQEGVAAESTAAVCSPKAPMDSTVSAAACFEVLAASEDPAEVSDALVALCRFAARSFDWDGPLAPACDKAVALNPSLPAALEARGKFKLAASILADPQDSTRLRSEAKEDFEKFAAVAPGNAQPLMILANLAAKQADFATALSYADKAGAILGDDASVHALRGTVHIAMKEEDAALADYLKCVRLAPQNTRALTAIARIYFQRRDLPVALDYVSKAVVGGQKDGIGEAFALRGAIRLQMGDAVQAGNDFRQALAANSFSKEALAGLEKIAGVHLPTAMDCQTVAGNYEEKVRICSAVLEYMTDYAVVESRAGAYLGLKKFDLAAADYTALIANEPDWPGYYFSRALAYEASGKLAEALDDVNTNIAKEEKKEKLKAPELSAERLAKALLKLGLSKEKIEAHLRRTTMEQQATSGVHLNRELRARVLAKLGREQEAIKEYSYILSVRPKHGNALLGRAEIYNRQGLSALAMADVNALIAVHPNFPGARALKDALSAKPGQH